MKPLEAVLSTFDTLKKLSEKDLKDLLREIRENGTDHDDGHFADYAAESMVEAFLSVRAIYNDEGEES